MVSFESRMEYIPRPRGIDTEVRCGRHFALTIELGGELGNPLGEGSRMAREPMALWKSGPTCDASFC